MFGGELDTLRNITTPKSEAFKGFFKPRSDEDYLDLGAYRGDTVDELLRYSGGSYGSITALEPDKKTFAKLTAHLDRDGELHVASKAIASHGGVVGFSGAAGQAVRNIR